MKGTNLLQRLALAARRAQPGTRTIVVSKGYCTPARPIVERALKQYGVAILECDEAQVDLPLVGPIRQQARVVVRDAQAEWAEYLLLRTGKLRLESRPQNRRNGEWAARRTGATASGPPATGGKCPRRGRSTAAGGGTASARRNDVSTRPGLWARIQRGK